MPLPNLIHPVNCTIQQINRGATRYDPDAREPVQNAARASNATVPGQPRWDLGTEQKMLLTGETFDAEGYVLFRYVDLTAASVTLQIGDRITIQGHITQEVYIVRLQPLGHYPDQNGASLLRAWFKDRLPAKER